MTWQIISNPVRRQNVNGKNHGNMAKWRNKIENDDAFLHLFCCCNKIATSPVFLSVSFGMSMNGFACQHRHQNNLSSKIII